MAQTRRDTPKENRERFGAPRFFALAIWAIHASLSFAYRLPITDYRLSPMANEKLLQLAPDLTRVAPRSPRAPLGAYGVLAARMLDKCRAELAGKAGDYHFNCPMDQIFFKFTKIDPAALKEFIATGANDAEVAHWIERNSEVEDPGKIANWARLFRLNPFTFLLDLDDWIHTRRAPSKG